MKKSSNNLQETADLINERLGTRPEFAKKVDDYFSKPRVVIHIPTKFIHKSNDQNGKPEIN
jgi:hypothetical protein